ncbi:MAG: hypothetical protein IJ323_01205 [Clostridia bacterium]|nr:hypothetical protein [Clostridia bacterium]
MKKNIVIIMIFTMLSFCSCNREFISIEQSKENFSIYQQSLQEVVEKYDLDLKEVEVQDTYRDFSITFQNSEILIRLDNSAIASNEGVESFSIDYYLTKDNTDELREEFNINLFVDLVNCISGKTISEDICDEFLNASEEKYSAEKYGYKKIDGVNIAKMHSFNFFEDWIIFYESKSDEELLSFGGLSLHLKS